MVTTRNSRRRFLKAAPVAASGFGLFNAALLGSVPGQAQKADTEARTVFQLFTAEQMAAAMGALQATPGNKNLVSSKTLPFAVVLTTEKATSAKQFEYHEGRDHIVQILDGSTLYEVGGTPVGAHSTRPGEWLAPSSDGFTSFTLKKGDMLVLPRGTPHRRSTAGSVTFLLISPSGTVPA